MVNALFLYKVTQQLPEYGVLFYRVSQEKKGAGGDIILGICAKGIIVYEVKNHTRIASLRFQWRETERISAHVSWNQVNLLFTLLLYSPSVCRFEEFIAFRARIRFILYRQVLSENSLKLSLDLDTQISSS